MIWRGEGALIASQVVPHIPRRIHNGALHLLVYN